VNIKVGELKVVHHAERDRATGTIPEGNERQSHRALNKDETLINANAYLQPTVPPSQAPKGVPITEATDHPRKMKVMALLRWCAGTSKPMHDAA
jgi:hypothetical protein